jgi:hypothetical protein
MDSSSRIVMARNQKANLLCVDAPGGKQRQLILNICSTSPTQTWYLNTLPGHADGPSLDDYFSSPNPSRFSSGQVQNKSNGMCIDIQGASTNNSTPVIGYDCYPLTKDNQRPWNQVWGAGQFMQTGAAYVFLRYNPPVAAGHVAWAVQLGDGSWEGGALDIDSLGIIRKGDNNGASRHHFSNEDALRNYFAAAGGTGAPNPQARYDRYMRWAVSGNINTAAMFSLESQSWDWGYGLFGNNCLDLVYNLMQSYGFTSLPSPPRIGSLSSFAPVTWFNNVMQGAGTEPLWLHGAP